MKTTESTLKIIVSILTVLFVSCASNQKRSVSYSVGETMTVAVISSNDLFEKDLPKTITINQKGKTVRESGEGEYKIAISGIDALDLTTYAKLKKRNTKEALWSVNSKLSSKTLKDEFESRHKKLSAIIRITSIDEKCNSKSVIKLTAGQSFQVCKDKYKDSAEFVSWSPGVLSAWSELTAKYEKQISEAVSKKGASDSLDKKVSDYHGSPGYLRDTACYSSYMIAEVDKALMGKPVRKGYDAIQLMSKGDMQKEKSKVQRVIAYKSSQYKNMTGKTLNLKNCPAYSSLLKKCEEYQAPELCQMEFVNGLSQ
jgi:hypothetical protein